MGHLISVPARRRQVPQHRAYGSVDRSRFKRLRVRNVAAFSPAGKQGFNRSEVRWWLPREPGIKPRVGFATGSKLSLHLSVLTYPRATGAECSRCKLASRL
jgi:hypothetical protein